MCSVSQRWYQSCSDLCFTKPRNSTSYFEITTVIPTGAQEWQQEDKVVAKNELPCSSF